MKLIERLCNKNKGEKRMNYKTLLITIGAILSIILLSVFAVQLTQNRAINLEETVETSKSDIDVQLNRRYNVLTELAECVKQYDAYEGETLESVIASRGTNMTDSEADEIMTQINAVAESYPELKSQSNYSQFMTEISTTENLVSQYKSAYNDSIKKYNRYTKGFPHKQFLGLAGYEVQHYEYYTTDKTDNEPIELFN
jgi:LemA protein